MFIREKIHHKPTPYSNPGLYGEEEAGKLPIQVGSLKGASL
jgi:hypothetical protein